MAVNNFKCLDCDKSAVCKIYDKLTPFNDEKKDLGVEITMDTCREFKDVK